MMQDAKLTRNTSRDCNPAVEPAVELGVIHCASDVLRQKTLRVSYYLRRVQLDARAHIFIRHHRLCDTSNPVYCCTCLGIFSFGVFKIAKKIIDVHVSISNRTHRIPCCPAHSCMPPSGYVILGRSAGGPHAHLCCCAR